MDKKTLARFRIMFVILILGFLLLTARIAYLQIVNYDYYVDRSERNRITRLPLPAPRGEIYDRDGQLLVTNRPGFSLSLIDLGRGYDAETIAFLATQLELEEEEIREKIRSQRYTRFLPVQLKRDITEETMARIYERRWKLQGVTIEPLPIREYKMEEKGSHLFGYKSLEEPREAIQAAWVEQGYEFRSGDMVGQRGLEQVWEPYLRGKDGEQLVETNYLGQPQKYLEQEEPVPGHNLHLTLDVELQEAASKALKDMVEELIEEAEEEDDEGPREVKRGSVVVLDPNSGAILAMENYPSYDSNTVRQEMDELIADPRGPLTNRAISGTYPIGSSFKMITGIAALEEGKISDGSTFSCSGSLTVDRATKRCHGVHGSINIYRGLAVSCNVFFYQAGLRADIDAISHYAEEFSLGTFTGLQDIRGEVRGNVASREYKERRYADPWYRVETMDAAIGQGFHSFTPLQMAQYVSMIANGGVHYRPYLVESVTDYHGELVKNIEPEVLREADVSEKTLDIIQEGMRRVNVPGYGGTAAYAMRNLEEETGGKTGTAETPDKEKSNHGIFLAYGPFEDPEIAVAVLIEHGDSGGRAAAPVAADIMEYYFGTQEEDEEEED